jgi:hypothetical protein
MALTALLSAPCALLCALWISSYFFWGYIHFIPSGTQEIQVISIQGRINVCYFDMTGRTRPWDSFLGRIDERALTVGRSIDSYQGPLGFGRKRAGRSVAVAIPYWFVLCCCALFYGLPHIKRFSIRALLITTALVASILSFVVYAV